MRCGARIMLAGYWTVNPERMAEMKRALTMMDADTIDGTAPAYAAVRDARLMRIPFFDPQARTVHRRAD